MEQCKAVTLTLREGVKHSGSKPFVESCNALLGVYLQEDLEHGFLLARQRLYPRLGAMESRSMASQFQLVLHLHVERIYDPVRKYSLALQCSG